MPPGGVSRSFSFTSSLWRQPGWGLPAGDLPLGFCGPAQQSYLEMSPQYHSASCREGGLPPLARPVGASFLILGVFWWQCWGTGKQIRIDTNCIPGVSSL